MPTKSDLTIWRGNNSPPVVWQYPAGFDLTGSEIVLTVTANGAAILDLRSANSELDIDIGARTVTWPITVAQSRLIPLGSFARYELERRVPAGEERTYCYGTVTGKGGDNSDV